MRALDIAASGLAAQQLNVDTISQNLANMNTTGYKSARVEFQDLLYQDLKRVGTNSTDQGTILPVGLQIGLGVKSVAISRNTAQGSLSSTQNALDLGINGQGYFQISLPDGTIAYTRDGSFKLSASGQIVTADGFTVQPGITVPTNATQISINASGQVEVTITGQTTPSQVGQLQLANFVNPNGLQAKGGNLYLETPASGTPTSGNPGQDQYGNLQQGYLESSNVDSVSAITTLVSAQRAYEMNTKVLKAADEMLQSLNQTA
ncbi:MAG: flagellar basal-body rod protein FlgG [Rhodospirillales bacterium 12-54-5]|nr:MAG: flagellar basal-body rod protein FlgG [Rhodospirillales bacterium 12-54-5]